MTSWRHATMSMEGNRTGTSRVSDQAVLGAFMVAPLRMTMQMDMFGVMHGARDDLTWMLMIPVVKIEMDHVNRMGVRFTTEADGLGDISLTALRRIRSRGRDSLLLQLGLGMPTGSIDEVDATPTGAATPLPYPMQLGSGTWDVSPGITWTRPLAHGSLGAQLRATLRLGRNDAGYSLGDRLALSAWGERRVGERGSASLRMTWSKWGDVDGTDSRLQPMMVPTARADLRGGERLDLGLGFRWRLREGGCEGGGQHLALEYLVPVAQDLDGPQLEMDHRWVLGWQATW